MLLAMRSWPAPLAMTRQWRSWAGPTPRATPWAHFGRLIGPLWNSVLQCRETGPTPGAVAIVALGLYPPLIACEILGMCVSHVHVYFKFYIIHFELNVRKNFKCFSVTLLPSLLFYYFPMITPFWLFNLCYPKCYRSY